MDLGFIHFFLHILEYSGQDDNMLRLEFFLWVYHGKNSLIRHTVKILFQQAEGKGDQVIFHEDFIQDEIDLIIVLLVLADFNGEVGVVELVNAKVKSLFIFSIPCNRNYSLFKHEILIIYAVVH
jgi:hypothetical protein